MTEHIAQKKYNTAFADLDELLADKKNNAIAILAVISNQMKRLYIAKLATKKNLGTRFVMSNCFLRYENIAARLIDMSRGFSEEQIKNAIILCAENDYKMKSSGEDENALLKETVTRIALGI